MTPNTFGVRFILKKDKADKDGHVPVYAKVTINSQKVELSLNRKIKPRDWLQKEGKLKDLSGRSTGY